MANYFSKYTGRKGPAIAPGIIEMMGSIGEEYGKGIEKFGEGIANYKKNKAEKNKAEADFENALTRMSGLYGEESIIYSVDDKIMSKLESGKGTKEDFLSAFNSLNTMEDSIEENRKREEDARRFGVTTGIQKEQLKATQELGYARLGSAEREGAAGRGSREGMHAAGLVSAEGEGAAGRTSREGMQDKDITARATEGAADRTSRKELQKTQITSTEGMHGAGLTQAAKQFKESSNQEFYLRMEDLGLRGEALVQARDFHEDTQNLAIDKMAQQARQFNDTLTETKRINQIRENVDARIIEEKTAGQDAYTTWHDKSQTTFDPDAQAAAMQITPTADDPWGGMTQEKIQSYLDNPEQFQRQITVSERAIKALQTPNLSKEVQGQIATWANADAGMGGGQFSLHGPTNTWLHTSENGVVKVMGKEGESESSQDRKQQLLRDATKSKETLKFKLLELSEAREKALAEHVKETLHEPGHPAYDAIVNRYNAMRATLTGEATIPKYNTRGELVN